MEVYNNPLPISGYAAAQYKRTDVHRRFADESFRQFALMMACLMVTVANDPDQDYNRLQGLCVLVALYR